jgi:hypothetical protein
MWGCLVHCQTLLSDVKEWEWGRHTGSSGLLSSRIKKYQIQSALFSSKHFGHYLQLQIVSFSDHWVRNKCTAIGTDTDCCFGYWSINPIVQ